MNIVLFDDLPEGGAKRVAFEHVKRLSTHHAVSYISNTEPTRFPFEKYAADIHKYDLNLIHSKSWKRPISELSYYFKIVPTLFKITALINRINPDVVIVHPSRLTQAPTLLQYINKPTLYFAEEWFRLVHEPKIHPLPFSPLNGFYEKNRRNWLARMDFDSVKAATKIVCTSHYTQESIRLAYGRSADLIPLGVDTERFLQVKDQKRSNYFLFIGGKEIINGQLLLDELKHAVGRKFSIKYVGFKKDNTFAYSDAQLIRLYQEALGTLCLAVNEPFGLVALESMACGTPVIAVDEGGYKDTVIHNRTGILIDRKVQSLIKAMKNLQNNSRLRERLGSSGRKRVTRYYSWDLHMKKLETILRSMKT